MAFAAFSGSVRADGSGTLRGSVRAEVASAYRSTTSGLLDTRPVATQAVDWHLGLGAFGYLEGYFWAISSLHDMQHESHRAMFYDAETAIRYGYALDFADGTRLSTSAGPYFDFPSGYRSAHMKCWGPYVVERLDNPWLTPYWKGLWLVEPSRRGRVCFGVDRKFRLADNLTLVPFAEATWMDERRFKRRYGSEPIHGYLRHGAFAHSFVGVKAKWKFGENLSLVATAAMCDIVNGQARRATHRSGAYYAKTDWPVFRLGVEYAF